MDSRITFTINAGNTVNNLKNAVITNLVLIDQMLDISFCSIIESNNYNKIIDDTIKILQIMKD